MKRDITDGALRSEESRPPSNKVVGFREQFQSLRGEIVLSITCLELNAWHSSQSEEGKKLALKSKSFGGKFVRFSGHGTLQTCLLCVCHCSACLSERTILRKTDLHCLLVGKVAWWSVVF